MAEGNVEFVRRWFDEFNAGGERTLELCDPECVIINPPEFPVRDTYRGHEGVLRWREDSFDVIDELQVVMEGVEEAEDSRVVVFLRLRGVASHTRLPIDAPWAAVITLRDGKFFEAHGYVSRREALRAAGLRD